MKAFFIVVTLFAAIVPYLVPTADASVALSLEGPSSGANRQMGALVLMAWAMVGFRLLGFGRR